MSDEQMNDFDSHNPSDANNPYLWDKSGPVDRDIEQLERKLQVLRYEGDAPQMRIERTALENRTAGDRCGVDACGRRDVDDVSISRHKRNMERSRHERYTHDRFRSLGW